MLHLAALAALFAVTSPAADPASSASPSSNPRHLGTPFFRTWNSEDFRGNPDFYTTIQDPVTGLIYSGCNGGIFEFDGVYWKFFSKWPSDAHALALDREGRLWKGATGDIQVATADETGTWILDSVKARYSAGTLGTTNAYFTVSTADGVFFADNRQLYLFGPGDSAPRTWMVAGPTAAITALWLMEGVPFLTVNDGSAFALRGGTLVPAPGLTAGAYVARPLPSGGGWELLGRRGLSRWDGRTQTDLTSPLGDDHALSAAFLADGRIAFGTAASGLILCDHTGRLLQRLDRTHGLPGNHIRGVLQDRDGGLWLTFNTHIARLEIDSPFARHSAQHGPGGITSAFTHHRGALYVGTTEGLWRRSAHGQFTKIAGVVPTVRRLFSHGENLYVVGDHFHVLGPADGDRVRTVTPRYLIGVHPLSHAPGTFVFGTHGGISWADFDGTTWQVRGRLPLSHGVAALLQSPVGYFWAGGGPKLTRFDFRTGPSVDAAALVLTPELGLPRLPHRIFHLAGSDTVLLQENGLSSFLRFDETAGRFVADQRLTGFTSPSGRPEDTPVAEEVISAPDESLWFRLSKPRGAVFHAPRAGPAHWPAVPLPPPYLGAAQTNTLWPDLPVRTLWAGTSAGLISRDLDWRPARTPAPPAAVVRRVSLAHDRTLYDGVHPRPAAVTASAPLDPSHDAVRLAYAAPFFTVNELGKIPLEYRSRLDGLESEWSDWTTETRRDFTNLPWRSFVFHVQARDASGRIGPTGTYAFTLRAPWWATRWAWAGYSTLGLLAVAGLVRVRTHALQRRADRLEQTVASRTRELAASNAQLATQNSELARLHRLELDEKIAAQLSEEKARLELLRYQLNPHFLLNALTTLRSLVFHSPEAAGRTVERLADFCRLALTRSEENGASVDDEVHLIESYLDTEKARWRDELQIELSIDPAARPLPLPPFLLQPLVENAIKYGGRTSPGTLHLRLTIALTPDALLLEIANTGTWVEADSPHRHGSTGIGLENLRQRLRRQYRDAHTFTTEARDGWVYVRLRLQLPATVDRKP